ncbi:HAMP domain-containing sensor histidine kinase [Sediminibacillus halophilus]|uniref:histidine kinase n=1 Tax=Sediminibacillus halophilus TaxID=482461 RepID=A0A1G9UY83_9BACI|nr:HAMP domain-containing sensor histidine kinase [Sediminibacillus halophilus]SDM64777.1 Signal transduction histidine kinase [Sediminibacillus halophilus]
MFKKNKKVSLQRYWTTRYLITLVVGLAVITVISALWIRHTTLENRLNMMEFMAEETADRIENMSDDTLPPEFEIHRVITDRGRFMNRESNPIIYVTDPEGTIISSNLPPQSNGQEIHSSILEKKDTIQTINSENGEQAELYVVKKPIETEDATLGLVLYVESKAELTKVRQEYGQLLIVIGSLLILGWLAIYFITGRLSKPIKEVAAAAKQIEEGNYDVRFSTNTREEEVHELITSFQQMSQKLEHLEALRTELLAGVSHELKTPVTSISGLLQAIDEGVVDKEEAKEFLQLSIRESEKMKTMVEDLLAFNKFAANAVPVTMDTYLINELIIDTLNVWKKTNMQEGVQMEVSLLEQDQTVDVDPLRVQQIMTNLLNNASQAIEDKGTISVKLHTSQNKVMIDVNDTGEGIPEQEQSYIFERFYRGENKKYKVGGLGLGLPFSKMIANVLNGDLMLVESSPSGTTFRFELPLSEQKTTDE